MKALLFLVTSRNILIGQENWALERIRPEGIGSGPITANFLTERSDVVMTSFWIDTSQRFERDLSRIEKFSICYSVATSLVMMECDLCDLLNRK
jgi:hypothetical protein